MTGPGAPPPKKSKLWLWILIAVVVVALIVTAVLVIVNRNGNQPPAPAPTTSAQTQTATPTTLPTTNETLPIPLPTNVDTFCLSFQLSLIEDPSLLGFVIDYATDTSDITQSLDGMVQTFQGVAQLNPPSAAVSPLSHIIGLLQDLQTTANQGDVSAVQSEWATQKDQLQSYFDAYKAAGTASCG